MYYLCLHTIKVLDPMCAPNTAIYSAGEPLWRLKWPLGPARVLLERSEGLFRACFGAASALEMAALACPGAASALKKAAQACFDAASALKIAILACSGATSAHKKPARACLSALSALKEACSSLLFEITIQKCWSRLHSALSHCTLLHFAPCMDMHGYTQVYIYSNVTVHPISGAHLRDPGDRGEGMG